MPPCELASFIHLQHGPSHAIEKSGCQEIRAQACAEDFRVTVRLLHGGEPQHFRFGHAADNCAHAVGYDKFGSGNGLRGYVIHLSLGNELRHVRKKERTHRLSHRANITGATIFIKNCLLVKPFIRFDGVLIQGRQSGTA